MDTFEAVKHCSMGGSVHNDGSGFRPAILHELKDRALVALQGYQALVGGFPLLYCVYLGQAKQLFDQTAKGESSIDARC